MAWQQDIRTHVGTNPVQPSADSCHMLIVTGSLGVTVEMLLLEATLTSALVIVAAGNTPAVFFVTDVTGEGQVGNLSGWQSDAFAAIKSGSLMRFKFPRAPHLLVAAEPWPPHVYVNKAADGSVKVTGPMGQLLDTLASSVNFTYSAVQKDGYWGAPWPNGSWNGMIGTVLRKEADLGLGPFGMSYSRSRVVDFTTPVFMEMLHVLVTRPLPEPNPMGFLAPFSWYVWVGLLLALLAMLVTSTAIVRILGFGGPKSVTRHFWSFYSISFTQSLPWVPTSDTLRLAFFTWMFIVLVVVRSYSGALTSLLAVKTVTVKYNSLRDVLDDPSLTLLMEGSTALTDHLQTVRDGVYAELARAADARAMYLRASETYDAAYSLIPDGNYAMLIENVVCRKIYSEHFSRTGRCSFYMSTVNFWRLIECMIVQKGSPLRQLLGVRIRAIREFGIYERWELDQMPNVTHCITTPKKIKRHEPYSMADLWAVFVILLCGFTLATAVFCCELLLSPLHHLHTPHLTTQ
ncbi:probable glutamate receptor [Panulirus ornatus]|uniref:probable glutamate receptor n=1 Tax=Panulirus ornatus TaxID=150431 RepID=UPI003A890618